MLLPRPQYSAIASCAALVALIALAVGLRASVADEMPVSELAAAGDEAPADDVVVEKYRYKGRVIPLSDALKRRGLKPSPETDQQMVLETSDGQLLPILADWRGRAFYQDERLRNRKVALIANRRSDMPYLQLLMVFTYDEQDRPQFTDYWCDVCAIPMYQIQPCECCQGDVRLRFTAQPIPDDVADWKTGEREDAASGPDTTPVDR